MSVALCIVQLRTRAILHPHVCTMHLLVHVGGMYTTYLCVYACVRVCVRVCVAIV